MSGESTELQDIIVKYTNIVKSMVRRIIINGNMVSTEDLEQVGMLALVNAIRTYDSSVGSLPSYLRACIRNAIIAEANKCCSVFTIDPRVRVQVNQIIKLRREGHDNESIMQTLGIRNRDRFLSLLSLVDIEVEILSDDIAANDTSMFDVQDVYRVLNDIQLEDQEKDLIVLTIANQSRKTIMRSLSLDGVQYANLKKQVIKKILEWGENDDGRGEGEAV
jgi:RNA polymerase sigma factor (sigma-70 family)